MQAGWSAQWLQGLEGAEPRRMLWLPTGLGHGCCCGLVDERVKENGVLTNGETGSMGDDDSAIREKRVGVQMQAGLLHSTTPNDASSIPSPKCSPSQPTTRPLASAQISSPGGHPTVHFERGDLSCTVAAAHGFQACRGAATVQANKSYGCWTRGTGIQIWDRCASHTHLQRKMLRWRRGMWYCGWSHEE